MVYDEKKGVPRFEEKIFSAKKNKYCLLIPIINEKGRIERELDRAKKSQVNEICDIVICDGDSVDGCTDENLLKEYDVTALLIKKSSGKQSAQLRMGFCWAINQGYEGFITIDGNNKDSIESVKDFVEKLDQGYDFVQGSRYIKNGKSINTPKFREKMIKFIHAPIISITAGQRFTDTTNAFRAYSKKYITDERVDVFRNIFSTYELLAYLSVRASQIKMKTIEIGVTREYPKGEEVPTKIKGFKGNIELFKILILNLLGFYLPDKKSMRNKTIYICIVLCMFISLIYVTIKNFLNGELSLFYLSLIFSMFFLFIFDKLIQDITKQKKSIKGTK